MRPPRGGVGHRAEARAEPGDRCGQPGSPCSQTTDEQGTRVDPQVQVGLLVDAGGFPLEGRCFTGNTAGNRTLIPVLRSFQDRRWVADLN